MIRCSKCNGMPKEHDIIGWKCNSCGKAFQVTKEQLHSLLVKKETSPGKSFFKCPSCGGILDDGNESIAWKCSCGHVTMGKLMDFEEDEEVEEKEEVIEVVSNISKGHLIECPECGKEISSKAKKCVHCGKVFVEEKRLTKLCDDCGKEVSVDSTECPFCGCPFEGQTLQKSNIIVKSKAVKKNLTKMLIPIALVAFIAVVGTTVYNIKVVKPKKIEAKNKATYEEAIELLEKGKYEEGNELLLTIPDYKDVDTILEQVKWETKVYECITDIRQYLKNPDSLQVYEVVFYNEYKENIDERKKSAMEELVKLAGGEPVCVMRSGGQNGFGGNTTDYSLFLYSESDGVYKYAGSCDTLNEDDIDDDDKEEVAICGLINLYKDNLMEVGNVDLARIKTIIKNDSYSTIKIIE